VPGEIFNGDREIFNGDRDADGPDSCVTPRADLGQCCLPSAYLHLSVVPYRRSEVLAATQCPAHREMPNRVFTGQRAFLLVTAIPALRTQRRGHAFRGRRVTVERQPGPCATACGEPDDTLRSDAVGSWSIPEQGAYRPPGESSWTPSVVVLGVDRGDQAPFDLHASRSLTVPPVRSKAPV
jgi:hypothetical protein